MLRPTTLLSVVALVLSFFAPAQALKFDLIAEPGSSAPYCVWNFVPRDTLVVVTSNVPPATGMRVNVEAIDGSEHGRVYQSKKDVSGEYRMAFTTHDSADVGVCFTIELVGGKTGGQNSRQVDLDIDIGANAVDYNAIANQESLSLLEVEMRKLEAVVKEIVDEMAYLQSREMRMRDTNESTNARVKWFSIAIIAGIFALGVWQLLHLRSFFKRKYLID